MSIVKITAPQLEDVVELAGPNDPSASSTDLTTGFKEKVERNMEGLPVDLATLTRIQEQIAQNEGSPEWGERYEIVRKGTLVARAILLPTGQFYISWLGQRKSFVFWNSFSDAQKIICGIPNTVINKVSDNSLTQGTLTGEFPIDVAAINRIKEHMLKEEGSPQWGRRFYLDRKEDFNKMSGTGRVASGIQMPPDGKIFLYWGGATPSLVLWGSIDDVQAIHIHPGTNGRPATVITWTDPELTDAK